MENKEGTFDRMNRVEEILANQLERRAGTMLENHTQTVIVFVILAVLSWVGYSILESGKSVNDLSVSIEVLKTDVKYMKTALDKASSNHVNINEFRISTNALQKEVSDSKARIRLLEQRSGEPNRKGK